MNFESVINIVIGIAFVIMSFYLADILNRRNRVLKTLGPNYKLIPDDSNKIPKWKISLAIMWVVFAVFAFIVKDELIINPYVVLVLAILNISSTYLGKGGFDNRGSISKKLFYNENGILLSPANKNNPFSSEYIEWSEITKKKIWQDPTYQLYYHVKIFTKDKGDKELFVYEKDKLELETLFDTKIK
jgi:hypothetical protein